MRVKGNVINNESGVENIMSKANKTMDGRSRGKNMAKSECVVKGAI